MENPTVDSQRGAIPRPLLVGLLVAILFMSLFALEISSGLVRGNGTIANSLFVLPPVIALFWGMLKRRRWALVLTRFAALAGAFWFYGWAVAAAVLRPTDQFGPVWIWLLAVSAVLGSILLAAFIALGRDSVQSHYAGN